MQGMQIQSLVGKIPGGGHGNPLQYSYQEIPMARMQRVANGSIAIIGHGGEKETFSGAQEDKEIHLSEAVQV